MAAADAYMKGIERRIEAGLDPDVPSVASLFISRWDVAVADEVPAELKNTLGIAVGKQAYAAYRELLDSERWQELGRAGRPAAAAALRQHRHQGPEASDTLYIEAFAAPDTINTMPEKTLHAFADHGKVGDPLPADGGDAEQVCKRSSRRRHRHRRARRSSSRRRAPTRSSSRGTSCSRRSSPSRSASPRSAPDRLRA